MKYYDLDPLPIVSGDPAELFFDDREDCEFARTLAARTAAIISQVRRYTVTRYTCPGRQIIVSPSTRTPGGWQVTFYHTDRITGDMEPSYHTDCDMLEKVAAEIPHSFCAADAVA